MPPKSTDAAQLLRAQFERRDGGRDRRERGHRGAGHAIEQEDRGERARRRRGATPAVAKLGRRQRPFAAATEGQARTVGEEPERGDQVERGRADVDAARVREDGPVAIDDRQLIGQQAESPMGQAQGEGRLALAGRTGHDQDPARGRECRRVDRREPARVEVALDGVDQAVQGVDRRRCRPNGRSSAPPSRH